MMTGLFEDLEEVSQTSVLQWIGGKSVAAKAISNLVPDHEKVVCSPFFGGGSVEFMLGYRGVRVHGYDFFNLLVTFWEEALNNPRDLADDVAKYHPLTKEMFNELKPRLLAYESPNPATEFFVMNRGGSSGMMQPRAWWSSHQNGFTENIIKRLREFNAPNVSVRLLGFDRSIPLHDSAFLYCDPPYVLDTDLYVDHSKFDHAGLAKLLTKRDRWILSYNDCPLTRKLYKGHLFVEAKWAYGTNKTKKSNEVLIFSKDRTEI